MATSGKELHDRDRERIRKLREQGKSVRQVAGIMSVHPSTVQRITKNAVDKAYNLS
jgi:IS30 family transposase